MRVSKLVARTLREDPKDAPLRSHNLLLRGGYILQVSTGIYTMMPLAKRITTKIERIIREEMNRIEGQEITMPVVMPRELWEEAGRYEGIGPEMLRFRDRNGNDMLLGMTHEEPVVQAARAHITSYRQLPVMMYQIQTKFRDEARSRGGLIRVREFTMKDAYSFHTTNEDMIEYYNRCHAAYVRIFRRAGLKNFIDVESDTGMMGGGMSHEFMFLTDVGEDTLFICDKCHYRANREVARFAFAAEPADTTSADAELPLEKVATPNRKTIEEVSSFLGVQSADTAKAVLYVHNKTNFVFVLIRGDFEVNETKLAKILGKGELRAAQDEEIRALGAVPGYASPIGLDVSKFTLLIDETILRSKNLVTGANEEGFHVRNFNAGRDLKGGRTVEIATPREGDACCECGAPLRVSRGIEIGNIFQLGTKYSAPMRCEFLDADGKSRPMIMGCYGIGVGRLLASVIEESHDDYGPIWPMSIAPYEVHVCVLDPAKGGVGEVAAKLVGELETAGVEVLMDDRNEKAGVQFADADLFGVPLRLILSPRNLAQGMVEFKLRGQKGSEMWPVDEVPARLSEVIAREKASYLE
ncbi:proline--tRNA ligase [Myxococcota bacterium]|nr:proline--tRNA ligase [Myxococcota bacterium]